MVSVSPNPSDRELVLAVIAGKSTPEQAIPLLKGNDPSVKGLILQELAKQRIEVAQAIGLVDRLDQLAVSRAARVAGGGGRLWAKVSPKAAVSVYGLQRMPVTLYVEQWERLLTIVDEIRKFAAEHGAQLKRKTAVVAA